MEILKTVSRVGQKRELLVWEINFDSVITFSFLFFSGIRIRAFVTEKQEYVGEFFLNVPIIGKNKAELMGNQAMLLVPKEFDKDKIEIGIEKCYYEEIIATNDALRDGLKNYIYGAGKKGGELYLELEKEGIAVEGFCVSGDSVNTKSYMGKKVFFIDELAHQKVNMIVAVYDHVARKQMVNRCINNGLENIYIDEFSDELMFRYNSFLQYLDIAIKRNKKIYIYSAQRDIEADMIEHFLRTYDILVDGYVCENSKADGIVDVYELAYGNVDDCFIIINERGAVETNKICNMLDGIGFSLEKHSYVGLHRVTVNYINMKPQILDPLMGHSVIFEEFIGIQVYGELNENNKKILILGGSTSTDGVLRPTAWTEYLWQKFRKNHRKDITIYNMAHCGDDVIKEFLRLIRDGWYLKPDLIVSMSGFNSTYYRTANGKGGIEHLEEWVDKLYSKMDVFNGIDKKESMFELWIRMEKLIEAAAACMGASFLCYLQPIKMLKPHKTLCEYYCFDSVTRDKDQSFTEESSQNDFYNNLLTLFDEEEGMFVDTGHYTEKANRILCDIVYEDIDRILVEE